MLKDFIILNRCLVVECAAPSQVVAGNSLCCDGNMMGVENMLVCENCYCGGTGHFVKLQSRQRP